MGDKVQILKIVGKASFIVTLGSFALVICTRLAVTRREEELLGATMAFLPTGLATWWVFRSIRRRWARREATIVTIAYGVSAPVSLLIGIVFAQIPGAYAGFLGRPFGLLGAIAGTVGVVTVLTFLSCLFASWMASRPAGRKRSGR